MGSQDEFVDCLCGSQPECDAVLANTVRGVWDSVGSQSDIATLIAVMGCWNGELPVGFWFVQGSHVGVSMGLRQVW